MSWRFLAPGSAGRRGSWAGPVVLITLACAALAVLVFHGSGEEGWTRLASAPLESAGEQTLTLAPVSPEGLALDPAALTVARSVVGAEQPLATTGSLRGFLELTPERCDGQVALAVWRVARPYANPKWISFGHVAQTAVAARERIDFRFDDLPPGDYLVDARWFEGTDLFLANRFATIEAGQVSDVGRLTVRPGEPLVIELSTPEGREEPPAGATVEVLLHFTAYDAHVPGVESLRTFFPLNTPVFLHGIPTDGLLHGSIMSEVGWSAADLRVTRPVMHLPIKGLRQVEFAYTPRVEVEIGLDLSAFYGEQVEVCVHQRDGWRRNRGHYRPRPDATRSVIYAEFDGPVAIAARSSSGVAVATFELEDQQPVEFVARPEDMVALPVYVQGASGRPLADARVMLSWGPFKSGDTGPYFPLAESYSDAEGRTSLRVPPRLLGEEVAVLVMNEGRRPPNVDFVLPIYLQGRELEVRVADDAQRTFAVAMR